MFLNHSKSRSLAAPHSLGVLLTRTPRLSSVEWQTLNWASRWLIMVRAVVLVMTLSSVSVGIVLAAIDTTLQWDRVLALLVGLTMAHACNNLVNDWTDQRLGVDRDNYFRRRYGTHVLEDGLVNPRTFLLVTVLTGCLALACAAWLIAEVGSAIIYLTLTGVLFVLFYTWPLKHLALGELAVLLVWGPLLAGGSYFVLTESINATVLLVSFLAGIGPTLVILGKHIDKYEHDHDRGIRTLPVVIGQPASQWLTLSLIAVHWLLVLVLAVRGMPAVSICLITLPALRSLIISLLSTPPSSRPRDFPEEVWPPWRFATAGISISPSCWPC